ncbi:hypothetical protein NE237_017889 [Protea cynaroides]|uniref:Uncharacterized protein n=1 Tax=Protea cynaroides TaxID=273540 RepID=A0A9Q0QNE6_9MAGN|nr:hypothetical protein NE237_017889 [Protea cynaroides]
MSSDGTEQPSPGNKNYRFRRQLNIVQRNMIPLEKGNGVRRHSKKGEGRFTHAGAPLAMKPIEYEQGRRGKISGCFTRSGAPAPWNKIRSSLPTTVAPTSAEDVHL